MALVGRLLHLFLSIITLPGVLSDHPCEDEVRTACPDKAADEVARCLKDPSQHDSPTDLSSACTDFVALNTACAGDIRKLCDGAFFSDDTVLCLKTWANPEDVSEKCNSVMEWAVPKSEEENSEDGEGNEEFSMSEEDYNDKKEWQANRKSAREAAIARMKMKEEDAKKEADRVAFEKFKEEDPEGYRRMIEQQEEEKRQAAAQKKKERMIQAAHEREKRKQQGLPEEGEEETPKRRKKAKEEKKKKGSWMSSIISLLVVGGISYFIYQLATGNVSSSGGSGRKSGGGKKKRG